MRARGNKTKAQLKAELDEANAHIAKVEANLDGIAGICAEDDEDDPTTTTFATRECGLVRGICG